MTLDETIELLGGSSALARKLGLVPSAVSNWRAFGAIPPRLYLQLEAIAQREGIDLDRSLFREVSRE